MINYTGKRAVCWYNYAYTRGICRLSYVIQKSHLITSMTDIIMVGKVCRIDLACLIASRKEGGPSQSSSFINPQVLKWSISTQSMIISSLRYWTVFLFDLKMLSKMVICFFNVISEYRKQAFPSLANILLFYLCQ